MSGPKDEPAVRIRAPAFAGMFYPDRAEQCRKLAEGYVAAGGSESQQSQWIGGIVPHAGWICSGAIAGQTIGTIAASREKRPDVVIVLGAIHTPLPCDRAMLEDYDSWSVPGSLSQVLGEVRRKLLNETTGGSFAVDDRFHRREHAVEVELPLIESAWPGVNIVPVQMPLIESADEIGRDIAGVIRQSKLDAVILASSDLTHYGPAYDFAPGGVGINGLAWAKSNDERLLNRVQQYDVQAIVREVKENLNACGGGAIAAMLSACRELGGTKASLLRHANSYETLSAAGYHERDADNAVGYASVVVG